MMRVLVCHVHYEQPGGEDAVFRAETEILRDARVEVSTLELQSRHLHAIPFRQRVRIVLSYSDHSWGRGLVRAAIMQHRPDVVHFHNAFPQLGPGAMAEADRLGCATLQTLHNHRLSCLTGRYLRGGEPCTLCAPQHFANGVRYGCYRGSRAQSLLVSRATTRQWQNFLYRGTPLYWLALTPFARELYVRFGAPADRVIVKPNSVDEGSPSGIEHRSGIFCGGLLSPEKGIIPLMRAWPDDAPLLTVAGDGPLRGAAEAAVKPNVCFLGRISPQEMRAALRKSLMVAMPSISSEGLPLVALEAFSEGTPVVSFDGWSLGSILREVSPQCVVTSRDFPTLARRACELATLVGWESLSERCVQLWRDNYSHPVNREALIGVYEAALARKRESAPS